MYGICQSLLVFCTLPILTVCQTLPMVRYRFLDGLDISSMKGFSKMVEIRNKVAVEPKVAAQYADKEGHATFKGVLSA
jgi:hypothetical protein